MKTEKQRKMIRRIESFFFFLFKKKNWIKLANYLIYSNKLNKIIKNTCENEIYITYSIQYFHPLFQRPQHIANEISKQGKLFFYCQDNAELINQINENLYIADLNMIIHLCKKNNKKPYLIVASTSYMSLNYLIELKKLGVKIIYEYIDEFSEEINDISVPIEIFNNLEKLEPVLILTTSCKLYNEMAARFDNKKILLNQNAVNLDDFLNVSKKVPDDMKDILKHGKPIVGYYGAMATWLNYDLINELSKRRPEYNFVYIGCNYNNGLSKLENNNNVFYLGTKDYKILPLYSNLFDIAIIPFKDGEIAKATSPLKLFEYMAVKKPVVCTKDLEECKGYEGVYIADDIDKFIEYVDQAIISSKDENLKEALFSNAKLNTWKQRCMDIIRKLDAQGEKYEN